MNFCAKIQIFEIHHKLNFGAKIQTFKTHKVLIFAPKFEWGWKMKQKREKPKNLSFEFLKMIFCRNDNAFLQEVLLCSRDWSCLVWKALRQPFPSSYWSTPHNDSIDSCKLIKSLSNPKHKQDCHFSLSIIPSHFLKSFLKLVWNNVLMCEIYFR